MSKRRLVNRCLMGAVLAVPATLLGIYSLGHAQEPESAAFPSEADLRPVLRVAQAEGEPAAGNDYSNVFDVPGGVAINEKSKVWKSEGVSACTGCHEKSGARATITALRNKKLDDGWCLLNELITWGNMDKHFSSYAVLLSERSKMMAKALDIMENGQSVIHRDQRCLACHSGMPLHEMGEVKDGLVSEEITQDERLNLGVSCEGCHGPAGRADILGDAQSWLDPHDDDGWRYLNPKIKTERFGFYDVRSPVSRTRMCASCHIGNAKEGRVVTHEMYAAGHPPLPGFELETFCDQEPEHWRNFRKKPDKVRKAFLEGTQEWREYDWSENEAEDTRDMLVAACISLSEYVKLNVDLARPGFEFPIKSSKYPSETWPEFAQFACYACHHDLQADGWRLGRRPVGVPGRPPMYEWPVALVQVAMQSAKTDVNAAKTVNQLIRAVQEALVDGPFGNPAKLQKDGAELARRLDEIALKLEKVPFKIADGQAALDQITDVAQSRDWDYDSARQLVWAYRIIYEELKGTSPTVEDLYATKDLNLDDVPGWYDPSKELDAVQQHLASFQKVFLVSLREGRVIDNQANGGNKPELPFLQWDAKKALSPIGEYHPDEFKKQMAKLKELPKNFANRAQREDSAE